MAMQPVFSPHLDDANPHKDTCGQSIQSSDGDDGVTVIAIEIRENTNTDGHTDRSDESERSGEQELPGEREGRGLQWAVRCQRRLLAFGGTLVRFGRVALSQLGDAGAQGDAFEHLVEEDDDEEGQEEGVSGNDQRNTNNWEC